MSRIEIISMNTDGIMIKVPPEREADADAIISEWEKTTGFEMERKKIAEYRRLNVNTYIAIDEKGEVKSKGLLNFQPGLDGDPNFTIIAESVAAFMKDGTPVEVTIMAAAKEKNLFKFAKLLTTNGPGFRQGDDVFGNVVRVYQATGTVVPIVASAHGRVGERTAASGCRIFRSLSEWPKDISLMAYIADAKAILEETKVVIDNRKNTIARELEALGFDTVGIGGSDAVKTGGNFSGSESIGVKVSPSRKLIYIPCDVPEAATIIGGESMVLRIDGHADYDFQYPAEIHRTDLVEPKALRAIKKHDAVVTNGKVEVYGDGVTFTTGHAAPEPIAEDIFQVGTYGTDAAPEPIAEDVFQVGRDGTDATPEPIAEVMSKNLLDMASECRDNWDYLEAIFGEAAPEAYVISFSGDPKVVKLWGGGPARLARNTFLVPDKNNFVCVSTFSPGADGGYSRRGDDFAALYCLLFDDIGTKAVDPRTKGFGPPTSRVETSSGNFQSVYALKEPITSRAMAEMLVKAVTRSNLGITDKSAGDITRVFRLPFGTNWKPENGPAGFQHRLVEWNPSARYTAEEILRWLGEDPVAVKAKADAMPVRAKVLASDRAFDHPVMAAFDAMSRLLDTRTKADGWIGVECPWSEDHSAGRKRDGAAVRISEDGTWGFNCMHDHCSGTRTIIRDGEEVTVKERGATAVMEWLRAHGHAASRPREPIWRSAFDDPEVVRRAEEIMAGHAPEGRSSKGEEGAEVDMSVFGDEGVETKVEEGSTGWPSDPFNPWDQPDGPEFPLDTLPDSVRRFVEEKAKEAGACKMSVAMSALTVASAALRHDITVSLNGKGEFAVRPRLWTLLAGDPSRKKSPVMSGAIKPLRRIEAADETRVEAVLRLMPEDERKKREKRGELEQGIRLVAQDSTPESLTIILEKQRPGILYAPDELATFIGQMDRYKGGNGASSGDRGFWVIFYDGAPYKVDRVTRKTKRIPCLSGSILAGIQPERLREMGKLTSDGLLQRFLPVMMSRSKLTSRDFDHRPYLDWTTTCERLFREGPKDHTLSAGAEVIRSAVETEIHEISTNPNADRSFAGYVGKLMGVFGSLALVLHYLHGRQESDELEADIAEKAQRIISAFLIPHGFLFYTELRQGGGEDLISLGACLGKHAGGTITRSSIKSEVRKLRGAEDREIHHLMELFVGGGWARPTTEMPMPNKWIVRPDINELFAEQMAAYRNHVANIMARIKAGGRKDDMT